MNSNSPKKNFLYNIIYQVLILIIPLITAPYLSRVVGAEGVGTFSYTYSIAQYFMLFCLLGINNYGNRTIAKVRDNKKELSKKFWSIYFFQLLIGTIVTAIYLIYVLLFVNNYKIIALIQVLYVISATVDINWFYFGLEEFKMTITRNTILKLGSVILIFLLVKQKDELWIYTLIMAGMTLLSQLVLWGFIKNKVSYTKIAIKDVLSHIKPNLLLFIPVIAVSLYKMMDKVMLGIISGVTEVGFYEQGEKITNIPLTLITALGTVMLPRISNIIAKGENEKVNQYISKSISFVMFMSVPMCFGLLTIGYNFAPLYLGNEFQKSGIVISLLSSTLPFISFANVIRTQYLIPKEKDKIYIRSVIIGAITNLILNLLFIPYLGSIGACIGTIAAEAIVMLYQSFMVRKEISIKDYLKLSLPFILKAIIMFMLIYPFNLIKMNSIIRIMLQVVLGVVIYAILNIKYINSIFDYKKLLSKILKRKCNS
ncbi:MAG: flippase [Candidatus Coprovivens sp.]